MDSKTYTLCIAGHRFIGERNGGVELQTYYIGKLLQFMGWKVTFLCPSIKGKTGYERVDHNFDIYWYCPHSFGFQIPRKSIEQFLEQIRPDVIYQRGRTNLVDKKIITSYCKKKDIPFVLSLTSDSDLFLWAGTKTIFLIPKNILKKIPLTLYAMWIDLAFYSNLKSAIILIAQHENQQKKLKSKFKKPIIILRTLHPEVKNKIKKSSEKIILWVNNYRPLKQGEVYIKLAEEYVNYNLKFIMVYGQSKQEYISKIVKLSSNFKNIQLYGQLSNAAIEKLLENADLFINTSIYEGFPNTFVQAWLRETPVISLNVDPGGVIEKEKIGICCHGNFNTLTAALKDLIENDKKRLEMGKRARIYAEKTHGFETNKYIYDRFFRALVERKSIEAIDLENITHEISH